MKKLSLILLIACSASASIVEQTPVLTAQEGMLARRSIAPAVTAVTCAERAPLKYKRKKSQYFKKSKPAMGYIHNEGPMWPIVCKNTKWGSVAGFYSKKKGARMTWGGKVHPCKQFAVVYGELVHRRALLPSHCSPRARQSNDKQYYYNIMVFTRYGFIPGKALENFKEGWYHEGNREIGFRHDDYYIVC